jgi:trigger factor
VARPPATPSSSPATTTDPRRGRRTDHGPIDFVVEVIEVQEKVLPDLTDEWVAEASELATIDELRADLRERLTRAGPAQAQSAIREKTAEALAALVDLEPPEALVSSEMQNRIQDMAMRLQAQGIQLEQFLAMTGQSQESFVEGLRDTANQAVLVDLALRSVVEAEGIEVTDDDLDAELSDVAERVGETLERVREEFERSGQLPAVRSDLRSKRPSTGSSSGSRWSTRTATPSIDPSSRPLAATDDDIDDKYHERDEDRRGRQ